MRKVLNCKSHSSVKSYSGIDLLVYMSSRGISLNKEAVKLMGMPARKVDRVIDTSVIDIDELFGLK